MTVAIPSSRVSPHRDGSHAPQNTVAPLVSDVGVVAFVPEAWGGYWQLRHQLMTRLARYFNVVWVNPAREWRNIWFGSRAQPTSPDPTVPPQSGFAVYQPGPLLPLLYRPRPLARLFASIRIRRAVARLRARGARRIVFYIWRPDFASALDLHHCDVACYHIDDEYTFSPVELPMDTCETELIRRVDQVIIHSAALLEKKGGLNPRTAFVPNGVDYEAFAAPHPEPRDLEPIPHPRIGYTGVVKHQLDLDLLVQLATRRPRWSFVLVGPCRNVRPEVLAQLQSLANVHLLGNKSIHQLPAYAQHMDVNIMPYVQDGYTQFIYPLKLHEYLASGRPVVATPIRSLRTFSGVISLADGLSQWEAALSEALNSAPNESHAVALRRKVAREHDWNTLTDRIAKLVAERLGPDVTGRLHSLRE